jgi:hypothetical protein
MARHPICGRADDSQAPIDGRGFDFFLRRSMLNTRQKSNIQRLETSPLCLHWQHLPQPDGGGVVS